jgi:hypothetical protein
MPRAFSEQSRGALIARRGEPSNNKVAKSRGPGRILLEIAQELLPAVVQLQPTLQGTLTADEPYAQKPVLIFEYEIRAKIRNEKRLENGK